MPVFSAFILPVDKTLVRCQNLFKQQKCHGFEFQCNVATKWHWVLVSNKFDEYKYEHMNAVSGRDPNPRVG